jgi:hypothetical protein
MHQYPGQFGAPPPPPQAGASSQAVLALVLALLGFFFCGCVTSIPAIFVARAELKAIDAGQSSPGGRSLAQVAFWIALVHSILLTLILAVYFVLVVFGFASMVAFS